MRLAGRLSADEQVAEVPQGVPENQQDANAPVDSVNPVLELEIGDAVLNPNGPQGASISPFISIGS